MIARARSSLAGTRRDMFVALTVPNYRRFFLGQVTSNIGTWMQMTAQAWLVLSITGSAADLGLIVALQTLPVLLLGPYGGVVADRARKRRQLILLQSAMGIQALILGVLAVSGGARLWELALLAVLLGTENAFENPTRQSFVLEMVGPAHLRNAVSLNSVQMNSARAIGPAIAGVLIATVGVGICFLINAVSFLAVIGSLLSMDTAALNATPPAARAAGQVREGLRYVRRTPALAVPLAMMALVGMLGYEFQVSLPVMARSGLHAGATGYGFMTAAMGVGAIAGGLAIAARGHTGLRPLIAAVCAFGVAFLLAGVAPNLAVELVALVLAGATSVAFMSTCNSTLQLGSDPAMRGRVMSLWFVALQGTTPIGGPLVGAIIAATGARSGFYVGASSCVLAAAIGALAVRRGKRARQGVRLEPEAAA